MSASALARGAKERLGLYWRLVRLDKPIGILLLLWPMLWALWIAADGWPGWRLLGIFVLGTVLMRSAGCAINDWADRDFDRHVKRTAQRPLTAGLIRGWEALAVAAVLSLLAFCLIRELNALTKWLSVAAVLIAASYPFFKRFFAIPQAYLGIAFGFGIPIAFAAVRGSVPPLAWLLLLGNIFWTIAYDTAYAMVDRDDDVRLGMRTSAITFGRHDVLAYALCDLAFLLIMAWVGQSQFLGWPFWIGLLAAANLGVYHLTLVAHRDRERCFKAFLHNNWLGACIFLGTALAYAIS